MNSVSKNNVSIKYLTVIYFMLFIKDLIDRKHEVTLGIDTNESFLRSKGDNSRLCSKCNLIDPIYTYHEIENEPNTYILG